MNTLELCCSAVVALWVVLRFAAQPSGARRALAVQMVTVAVAAWIAEDSCIRVYGFYGYSADAWQIFVDRVPLLVLLIWPVVVTSAIDLAAALRVDVRRLPVVLLLLVVADAWFIEPIAVDAGLWSWTESGPFAVPTIGVLGWGCFALGVGVVVARGLTVVLAVVVAPIVCHVLLLVLWWGTFRWLPDPPHPFLHPSGAWLVAIGVVVAIVRARPVGLRRLVWLRAPAAVFFFALLWLHGRDEDDGPLLVWSLAFAPPWLAFLLASPPSSADARATSQLSAPSTTRSEAVGAEALP
jgi:hypothetical protein